MGWVEQGTKIPVIHFWEWKKGKEEITHVSRRKETKPPKGAAKERAGRAEHELMSVVTGGGKRQL